MKVETAGANPSSPPLMIQLFEKPEQAMNILDEILAGIAAVLIVTIGVLLIMNANLRADLATAKSNASTLTAVNTDLKNGTDEQNRALARLKAESEGRNVAAAKAEAAAAAQAKRYTAEASAVGARVAGGDDCGSAKQLLSDYLKSRE